MSELTIPHYNNSNNDDLISMIDLKVVKRDFYTVCAAVF